MSLVLLKSVFLLLPKVHTLIYWFLFPSALLCCHVLAGLLLPCQWNTTSQSWQLYLQLQHHSRQQFQARLAAFHLQWPQQCFPVIFVVVQPFTEGKMSSMDAFAGLLSKSRSLQQNRQKSILLAHISFSLYPSIRRFKAVLTVCRFEKLLGKQ